ncbi:MAG: hypothetical protein ACR2KJ_14585 [Jatrophihabitans sp.]
MAGLTGRPDTAAWPASRGAVLLALASVIVLAASLGLFGYSRSSIQHVVTVTDTSRQTRLSANGCPDGLVCAFPSHSDTALSAIQSFLPEFRATFEWAQAKADTQDRYVVEVHGTVGTEVTLLFRAQCIPGGGKVGSSTLSNADGARITVGGVPGASVSIVLLPTHPSVALPTHQAELIAASPLSQIGRC